MRIIAAVGEGEEQKAQEWLVYYQGVQEECDDQKQQEIDQWILNGNTEQLKEMFERSLLKKDKIHPLRRAVIVMLLTYSVIFTGMARGINTIYIAKQIQGKEMVVSHDEKYAYLDVTISDSQKMRYRTNTTDRFLFGRSRHQKSNG